VVFAQRQLAGRGRLGRRWESAPDEALAFSLLLRPALAPHLWARLSTWAAIGVAHGIDQATGCRPLIKWPNDVQLDGRKVAGILVETHNEPTANGAAGFAVVGIGINVNQTEFPAWIAPVASSLRLAAFRPFDRETVAAAVLSCLDEAYADIADGFGRLVAEAADRSALLGRWIELRRGSETIAGLAERLDEHGALVLRTQSGESIVLASGEVTSHHATARA
jgi:BirA family biotin operon repressor/biotin-[acetyl-CoA-carboxylase] ligase